MNTEIFAEWLRRQGHQVVRTASSLWFDAGPRVYEAFPYNVSIKPSNQELKEFLIREKAVGLRYSSMSLGKAQGKISYHIIFDTSPYDLQVLSGNARSKVRRGLKRCNIELIPMERLAQEGWRLQRDTLERQGRSRTMSQDKWQQVCLAAKGLPGFEAWAALVKGELAATILTACIDDTCYVLYAQSHRQFFNSYANNALCYTMSHEVLSRPNIRIISYGQHSLDAPPSVDDFKFHMSYRAQPVHQRIVFHPWLTPVFNPATYAVLKLLLRLDPQHPTLSKAEGMLRFHLEGKRPPGEQNWPDCLSQFKKELLKA